jgi:hypothetical protein
LQRRNEMSAAADYVRFYVTVHTKGEGKLTAATEKTLPKGSGEGIGRFYVGRRDVWRDAYAAVAVGWVVLVLAGVFVPSDAQLWWTDGRLPNPYAVADYGAGTGFYYSPPVALALAPFTLLPFPVFGAAMIGLAFASLWYLAGRWSILLLAFPPVFWELSSGNIALPLAAVSLLGLRYPGVWAFALLTKVTPGVGLLWFAVRREWRSLAIALGVTAGLLLVTAPLVPAWLGSLAANQGYTGPGYFTVMVPLLPRLAAAALLVAWGARTDRRWVLPVAVTIAVPVLWFNALAGLVGAISRRGASPAGPGSGRSRRRTASGLAAPGSAR